MIEVFKTDVTCSIQSAMLVDELSYHFPGGIINFDLEDEDRILRIVADHVAPHKVIGVLQKHGYAAEVLM